RYLVLASNNADFQVSSEGFVFQYQILDVSAYSIVFRENEILVTERESGIPAVNQKVDVFETKNNNESKVKTLTTNEFGIADVNYSKENYRTLAFKMVGEEVSYHNYYYRNHSDNSPQVGKSSKIFTDRA